LDIGWERYAQGLDILRIYERNTLKNRIDIKNPEEFLSIPPDFYQCYLFCEFP